MEEKAQQLLDAARLLTIQGSLNDEDAATFDELAEELGNIGIGLELGEDDGEIILLS